MSAKHIAHPVPRCLHLAAAVGLLAFACSLPAQVAPLAPKWLAGTPPPPVETFSDGLQRHHIPITETSLIAALQDADPEARSLAAAQLAASDDHSALTQILSAMELESDLQVKINLAGAASWLGSRRAVEELQVLCQNQNVPALSRLDAARYVSHKEIASCFSSVKDIAESSQDPAVRLQALIIAVNYHGQSVGANSLALADLTDADRTIRITATDALKTLHAVSALDSLRHALESENDDTVREHLREAIRVLNIPDKDK